MKSVDKFLIAIVAGVILLIVITLAVIFLKPEPTYQSEDSPEGIVHNYILALKNEDYGRAYSYISKELPEYPKDLPEFTEAIDIYYWDFDSDNNITWTMDSVSYHGSEAIVTVSVTHYYDPFFFEHNYYSSTFHMWLELDEGKWAITDAEDYFIRCWTMETGCQ